MGYSLGQGVPFANDIERDIHFLRHGHKFGIPGLTVAQYVQMADTFLHGAMNISMRECVRPNRTDRLRSDLVREFFGVAIDGTMTVRTFYPPEQRKILKHGGMAGFHAYECARTNL